jgi:hypothetical protein
VSAGQAEQDEAPDEEIEPGEHGEHDVPSLLKVPALHGWHLPFFNA